MTTIGSLCSGYGGLDLAAEALTGGDTIWLSEIDPWAATVLEARYPGVTNLGDFTADPEADRPDVLTAGFPCQPFSVAGKGHGIDDPRWLWPAIVRLITSWDQPPATVLLENVPGLKTISDGAAWTEITTDLKRLGYDHAHLLVRASDIGACHRRRRLFVYATHRDLPEIPIRPILTASRNRHRNLPTPNAWDGARGPDLARAARPRSGGMDLVTTVERLLPTPLARDHKGHQPNASPDTLGKPRGQGGTSSLPDATYLLPTPTARESDPTDAYLADIRRADRGNRRLYLEGRDSHLQRTISRVVPLLPTPTAADENGSRRRTARKDHWSSADGVTLTDVAYADWFGDYAEAIRSHAEISGCPPPRPTDDKRRLNPAFVEWMMMLPAGWVTEVDGLTRRHALRILGNGVVPAQAAAAYTDLAYPEQPTLF